MSVEFVIDKLPEDVKAQIKTLVAEQLASGRGFDEIAKLIKEKFDVDVTDAQVKYYVYREFGDIMKSEEKDGDIEANTSGDDDIDVMKELVELYMLQKGRVRKLCRMEKEIGIPVPENTRNIAVALSILDKIARIKMQSGLSALEIRDKIIEDILEEVEEG